MPNIYAYSYGSQQNGVGLQALPGGALATADWIQTLIARGKAGHITIGAFSTPITGGGAGTVLDLDQVSAFLDELRKFKPWNAK